MILSHTYKYVFVEMNHTASTAISEELCAKYGGQEILWKHARYRDFMQQASAEEKNYFSFSGKRNPLDIIVTLYFRHKLDPDKRFFDIQTPDVTVHNYKMYRYLAGHQIDFPAFFLKFFRWRIYYEWNGKDFKHLDYVYRFENLQDDFSHILKNIGVEQLALVPIINQTAERSRDFLRYYTPGMQQWAQVLLRDLMKEWGYDFPVHWLKPTIIQWLYYYFFLKPIFFIRCLFHFIIDRPFIFRRLYITESGLAYTLRRLYKWWRGKTIP